MKIKPDHYSALFKAINALPKDKVAEHYKYLTKLQKTKPNMDLEMRFRWDCLYASKFDCKDTYSYAHDSHIDTALKKIVKELDLTAPLS